MAKEAASVSNTDWGEYFASIVSVCPWSKSYWKQQRIDIQKWQGEHSVESLREYVARMYIHRNASGRILCNIHHRMNDTRPHEEWLYSHPSYKGFSTPVGVLIQQDLDILSKARKQHALQSKPNNERRGGTSS